jgi:hypothetical protein
VALRGFAVVDIDGHRHQSIVADTDSAEQRVFQSPGDEHLQPPDFGLGNQVMEDK